MEETRCCGTGTCLIDANGRCWCGQQWNGEQMCHPDQAPSAASVAATLDDDNAIAPDAESAAP